MSKTKNKISLKQELEFFISGTYNSIKI